MLILQIKSVVHTQFVRLGYVTMSRKISTFRSQKKEQHTHTNLAQSLSVENAKRNEKCLESNGKN